MEDEFDFLLLWISQTDLIQHICWDKPIFMLDFFQEVDRVLADMLFSFPDHILLIMSDHGFDGFCDRPFHVNAWLAQQGYLKMRGGRLENCVGPWVYSLANKLASKQMVRNRFLSLWHWLREKRKQVDEELSPQSHLAHSFYRRLPGVDWRRSVAFLDQDWGIRVLAEA